MGFNSGFKGLSNRRENSGGQFWKGLWFTKDCNGRRRRYASFLTITLTSACYESIHVRAYSQSSFLLGGIWTHFVLLHYIIVLFASRSVYKISQDNSQSSIKPNSTAGHLLSSRPSPPFTKNMLLIYYRTVLHNPFIPRAFRNYLC